MVSPPTSRLFFNILKSFFNKTQLVLLIGFTFSIALFLILTNFGLNQLENALVKNKAILEIHNVKMRLVDKMELTARERMLAMYNMVFIKDPFERDDVYLKFKGYAIDFINAREQLLSMKLNAEEKQLIARQGSLTAIAVPLQNQFIDYLYENKLSRAYEILNEQALPAQNRVLNILYQLQKVVNRENENIARSMERQYQEKSDSFVTLALLTLLLTLSIALFVSRVINHGERKLYLEKELAQVTLHSIGDGVITTDNRGIINTINPVGEELTGFDSDEAIGKDIAEIFRIKNETTGNTIDNPIEVALQNNTIYTSPHNIVLTRKNGDIFAIEHTISPIRDYDDKILGANIVFRDVTEMRKLADELSYQATHDSLTGLINRREFERRLKKAIYHAHNDGYQYALCFLDLDQFKLINDTAGHAAGDEFLKQVSHKLAINLRRSDILARLGGDEFAILLDNCNLDTATVIANKICKTVKETQFRWENHVFSTGTSIGIVPINEYTSTVSEAMSVADTACYEAKENGRNRVQTYWLDDSKLELKRQEMAWVQKLEHAFENDNFQLYAQEFINIAPGGNDSNLKFYEVLLRFKDNDGNILPPMAFLPAAERYHLMPQIDYWVIENTFKLARKSREENGRQCHFSINLSGQTITEPGLYDFIIKTADKYQVDPCLTCFEVTETAAIANMSKAVKLIHNLKSSDFRFSLDDFGSGLSSFAYLKNMPVDNLKIDGAFIRDIVEDKTDRAFVEAIQRIAQMMNIRTTAEFVENQQTLDILKDIGVDFVQGNHIAQPASLVEIMNKDQMTREKRVLV